MTKHHLQSAKHNISSESLTPSGHQLDGGEGVDEDGDEGKYGDGGDKDDGDEDGVDGDDGDEDEGHGDEDGGDQFDANHAFLDVNFAVFSATCATSLDIKDKDVESICM